MQGIGVHGVDNSPPAGTVLTTGTDKTAIRMLCWNCDKWGHIDHYLPDTRRERSGTQFMQVGYGFGHTNDSIPLSWMLLDTCLTSSVFCNNELVNDLVVRYKDEVLLIHINGGT